MKNKVLFILCLLFGLMMINAGLNKFFNYLPMPELTEEQMALFGAFATIKWIFPLVAFIEVIGGVMFIIPKTRALAALVILPVMVGIVAHHAAHDPAGLAIPLIMMAINILVIVDNKDKYMPMLG